MHGQGEVGFIRLVCGGCTCCVVPSKFSQPCWYDRLAHPQPMSGPGKPRAPACPLTKWLRSRRQCSAHHGSTWAADNTTPHKGCIAVSSQSRQSINSAGTWPAQQRCCATYLQRAQRVVGAMPVTVRVEAHCTQQCAGKEMMQLGSVGAGSERGGTGGGQRNMPVQPLKQLAWKHAQVPATNPQRQASTQRSQQAGRLTGRQAGWPTYECILVLQIPHIQPVGRLLAAARLPHHMPASGGSKVTRPGGWSVCVGSHKHDQCAC